MSHERPVLALTTPRQTAEFLALCGVVDPEIVVVGDLASPSQRASLVRHTVDWASAHPTGVVLSTSDWPSLIQAIAQHERPDLPALAGPGLATALATIDKAWARTDLVRDNLPWAPILAHQEVVPQVEGAEKLLFKPLDGCASVGIRRVTAGDSLPSLDRKTDWLDSLRQEILGDAPYPTDTVALVEAYVPPHVQRVSVDGWITADGEVIPVAVSDNVYVDGEPERFHSQRFPSHVSEAGQAACFRLYKDIGSRLVGRYGMRKQPFDIEMFVWDQPGAERVAVMEINARMHPNITPILHHCFDGVDFVEWHATDSTPFEANGRSGVLEYIWTDGPAPDWGSMSNEPYDTVCGWDRAGPASNGKTCWGWRYRLHPAESDVRPAH